MARQKAGPFSHEQRRLPPHAAGRRWLLPQPGEVIESIRPPMAMADVGKGEEWRR
jgi:hypothetical protein